MFCGLMTFPLVEARSHGDARVLVYTKPGVSVPVIAETQSLGRGLPHRDAYDKHSISKLLDRSDQRYIGAAHSSAPEKDYSQVARRS